eukprot:CAMPEP_0206461686 /NCGR_PEP_ID=MMETSP0324_2-20121206/25516_1 /ASSEMBLY_ACC=CAM_ASM_000836 /TAXON_ID=2866 /ORGANISM="Crypthecodinium cohnii, Strain Seligo" /LENGTH=266 /DNA_ID=CAMNT_0053933669 /DNA_START=62 /DNA_END=862 /DNA_ORIENTATION=-
MARRSPAALVLQALSLSLALSKVVADVDCGGHYASGCSECPQGNAWAWCNGDCTWLKDPLTTDEMAGKCLPAIPLGVAKGGAVWYQYLFAFTGYGIVLAIFAAVYYAKVITYLPSITGIGGTRVGLFDCLKKPDTCLHVTFCLPVSVGKNYHASGLCNYWAGCLSTFFLSFSPCFIINTFIRAYLSYRMQEELGFSPNIVKLFCVNLFCLPCEVGRESLEVDAETGADINCCCQIKVTPKPVVEVVNLVAKVEDRTCSPHSRVCGY